MALTENMRITMRILKDRYNADELEEYGEFLLRIGEGREQTYPEFGDDVIKLPENIVSKSKTLDDFIDEIFPDIAQNFNDAEYMFDRAILTPLNVTVDRLNQHILDKCPGDEVELLSADSMDHDEKSGV